MSCSTSKKDFNLCPNNNINNLMLIKFIQNAKNLHKSSLTTPTQPIKLQQNKSNSYIQLKSDFPSIFSKHKRNQYSGYKQIYINKSKAITFQTDNKEVNRYRTQRKYEINLKNIAKLRKKYSLEPISHKNKYKEGQFNQSVFLAPKRMSSHHTQIQEISTERMKKYDLKEMINEQKKNEYQNDKDFQKQQHNLKDLSQIKEMKLEINKLHTQRSVHILNIVEKIQHKKKDQSPNKSQISSKKPLSKNFQKKFQKRFHGFKYNKKQTNIQKNRYLTQMQEEVQLCGWENDSYYEKVRSRNVRIDF